MSRPAVSHAGVSRPARLVVVTGTGTEVGKTWWAAALARGVAGRGASVAARKPVQSFSPGDAATDADVLAAATGEDPGAVCPSHRWLPIPMAPPMAAAALGRPRFTLAELVDELVWPATTTLGLVEGAGGVRAPLADDGDTLALVRALDPDDVLVVADAGLGTINVVRLTIAALGGHRCVVALNRFDEENALHRANRDWLGTRDGFDVVTDPGILAARWAA